MASLPPVSTEMGDGTLVAAIRDAHIIVTTGAGGVGKTTTAAALGVAASRAGRRTLVMTIDPARRLAQSMGLEELSNVPTRVTVAELEGDGELHAMMLDMESTFDQLIERTAASPEAAAGIRENQIYKTLSSSLSGTQEYMAMEKLHELHTSGEWDLLIIDTPPTRNALDFLDAPKRMGDFLDGKLLRVLMKPGAAVGKTYLRAVNFGATAFMKIAGKVTGMELLEDLASFFRNFEGMYEGFKQRADEVLVLLQDPRSVFVVVTSPQPPPLREARYFLERLREEGLHSAGLVVNRLLPLIEEGPDAAALRRAAADLDGGDEGDRGAAGALRVLADTRNLGARQRRDVRAAVYGHLVDNIVEVPLLRTDVHDLEGLEEIASKLVS